MKIREADMAMPFLPNAACSTPDGIVAHDEFMGWHTVGSEAAARRTCDACPLLTRARCLAWVLRDEHPSGVWVGMYAGMTPMQRLRQFDALSYRERDALAEKAIRDAETRLAASPMPRRRRSSTD